jgi:glycosyltransferase involved in cell wall biosynthesis
MKGARILACASQGSGSSDEKRLEQMLSGFCPAYFALDRSKKFRGFFALLWRLRERDFDLLVVEGTGAAIGVAAIIANLIFGVRYVISSGDAVAPFLAARFPFARPVFSVYERALCQRCAGFVGWSPYLVGRALTFGAKRAISVPGWPTFELTAVELAAQRGKIRDRFNIPEDAIVYGIVGSLNWSKRYNYCYGVELVKALHLSKRQVYGLIVGDGTGLGELRALAGDALGKTIFLPGRIPRDEVPGFLAAMDVGSLPQSVDQVGNFRYTTKVAEYRMVGLPFVSNQTSMSYDLNNGDIVRLPGAAPWSDIFVKSLAKLMESLTREQIADIKATTKQSCEFELGSQIDRVAAFVRDILDLEENL